MKISDYIVYYILCFILYFVYFCLNKESTVVNSDHNACFSSLNQKYCFAKSIWKQNEKHFKLCKKFNYLTRLV